MSLTLYKIERHSMIFWEKIRKEKTNNRLLTKVRQCQQRKLVNSFEDSIGFWKKKNFFSWLLHWKYIDIWLFESNFQTKCFFWAVLVWNCPPSKRHQSHLKRTAKRENEMLLRAVGFRQMSCLQNVSHHMKINYNF